MCGFDQRMAAQAGQIALRLKFPIPSTLKTANKLGDPIHLPPR